MGAGSSLRPTGTRDPPSKRHRGKPASDKPDYSQNPLPERHKPRTRAEPDSWRPNPFQAHALPRRKRRNKAPLDSNYPSVNPLKSKIRDLTRALQHSDLPADIRVEKERALAGYEQDLENALEEKRKRELIGKYHMVRFFERQKATRHIKKIQKRLVSTPPDTPDYKQLKEKLHLVQTDLNYTLYYPLYQKYEAIYPRKEDSKSDVTENGEPVLKPAMWKVVEKCMEDGTLDALRDGTLDIVLGIGRMKLFKKETRGPKSQMKNKVNFGSKPSMNGQSTEMDEDSDGGFFEDYGGVKLEPS